MDKTKEKCCCFPPELGVKITAVLLSLLQAAFVIFYLATIHENMVAYLSGSSSVVMYLFRPATRQDGCWVRYSSPSYFLCPTCSSIWVPSGV